ncbi:hypothetical protein K7432_008854, partial [Basidiobolus ranarum]
MKFSSSKLLFILSGVSYINSATINRQLWARDNGAYDVSDVFTGGDNGGNGGGNGGDAGGYGAGNGGGDNGGNGGNGGGNGVGAYDTGNGGNGGGNG